jgi:hypothetical protein
MQTQRSLTFATIGCAITACAALWGPALVLGQPAERTAVGELQRARALLGQQTSIVAQLVETVTMFDRTVKADGRYIQTNDRRIRLELKLRVGNTTGSLLEVCDGEILWVRQDIGKDPYITRRNVKQILEAAERTGAIPQNVLVADLGLGGLPSLLASIERSFDFDGLKDDTLRDRPVVTVQGHWNEAMNINLRGSSSNNPFPAYIPDIVRVTVDRETGFPHRIMYLKKVPDRDTLKPMLTLDFLDVKLGQPIDPSEFTFVVPERVQPHEETQVYINMLKAPPAPPATPAGS